jgi:hypothetical protein
MKWWKKALIGSVAWAVLMIAAALILTQVVLAGRITEQQADAIAFKFGIVGGAGMVLIPAILYFHRMTRMKD